MKDLHNRNPDFSLKKGQVEFLQQPILPIINKSQNQSHSHRSISRNRQSDHNRQDLSNKRHQRIKASIDFDNGISHQSPEEILSGVVNLVKSMANIHDINAGGFNTERKSGPSQKLRKQDREAGFQSHRSLARNEAPDYSNLNLADKYKDLLEGNDNRIKSHNVFDNNRANKIIEQARNMNDEEYNKLNNNMVNFDSKKISVDNHDRKKQRKRRNQSENPPNFFENNDAGGQQPQLQQENKDMSDKAIKLLGLFMKELNSKNQPLQRQDNNSNQEAVHHYRAKSEKELKPRKEPFQFVPIPGLQPIKSARKLHIEKSEGKEQIGCMMQAISNQMHDIQDYFEDTKKKEQLRFQRQNQNMLAAVRVNHDNELGILEMLNRQRSQKKEKPEISQNQKFFGKKANQDYQSNTNPRTVDITQPIPFRAEPESPVIVSLEIPLRVESAQPFLTMDANPNNSLIKSPTKFLEPLQLKKHSISDGPVTLKTKKFLENYNQKNPHKHSLDTPKLDENTFNLVMTPTKTKNKKTIRKQITIPEISILKPKPLDIKRRVKWYWRKLQIAVLTMMYWRMYWKDRLRQLQQAKDGILSQFKQDVPKLFKILSQQVYQICQKSLTSFWNDSSPYGQVQHEYVINQYLIQYPCEDEEMMVAIQQPRADSIHNMCCALMGDLINLNNIHQSPDNQGTFKQLLDNDTFFPTRFLYDYEVRRMKFGLSGNVKIFEASRNMLLIGYIVFRVFLGMIFVSPDFYIKQHVLTLEQRLKLRTVGSILYNVFFDYSYTFIPYNKDNMIQVEDKNRINGRSSKLQFGRFFFDNKKIRGF